MYLPDVTYACDFVRTLLSPGTAHPFSGSPPYANWRLAHVALTAAWRLAHVALTAAWRVSRTRSVRYSIVLYCSYSCSREIR